MYKILLKRIFPKICKIKHSLFWKTVNFQISYSKFHTTTWNTLNFTPKLPRPKFIFSPKNYHSFLNLNARVRNFSQTREKRLFGIKTQFSHAKLKKFIAKIFREHPMTNPFDVNRSGIEIFYWKREEFEFKSVSR